MRTILIGSFPHTLPSMKAVSYWDFFFDQVKTRMTVKSHEPPSGPLVPTSKYCGTSRPLSSCAAFSENHATIRMLEDRKSTRLNSSHPSISYAVFCLKKKNRP